MRHRVHFRAVAGLVAASAIAGACETAKSSNPLSPSVAGPIPGVSISAPKPLEPGAGTQLRDSDQPLTLLIENASSTGQRPLSYSFEIATDTDFKGMVFVRDKVAPGEGGRTSLRLPDPLASGRSYYWRARAADGANTGPYSSPVDFRVVSPVSINKPNLLSPANNEQVPSVRPTFRWENVPRSGPVGAVKYTVEIANAESFTSKLAVWQVLEQPTQTTYQSPQNWTHGQYLFWRVRASTSDGSEEGPWSDPRAFLVFTPVVIGKPTLVSPANNERVSSLRPTFTWSNASRSGPAGAIKYTVEVSDVESFGNKLAVWQVAEQSTQTSFASPQDWSYGQYLFWHVRASDGTEQGAWSDPLALRLPDPPAPLPPPPAPSPSPSPSPVPIPAPPPGGRTPDPPPGQRLPLPDAFSIVQEVARTYPSALKNSCQDSGGSWEFMDRLVDRLRQNDSRWGYNWKRGNVGDPSKDVVDYHFGRGPDEGSTDVYIIDVIGGHCSANPSPGWTDVTASTAAGGTIGRWTGRGRF
ncbi:MAG: hypothetical protein HYZ58_05145 [Acidobacteria bacterium]|nr:hypothetical protein [Acidobacteriota bacterium]